MSWGTVKNNTGCLLSIFIIKVFILFPGLDEAQAGSKIAGRNINNQRYANDTTIAESEEELKSLLVKVKEESEKVGFKAQHSEN